MKEYYSIIKIEWSKQTYNMKFIIKDNADKIMLIT